MKYDGTLKEFETSGGIKIYKMPVEAFPGHLTNCYLILDDVVTLVDVASGTEAATQELRDSFDRLKKEFGISVAFKDVGRLIITHGHIDHFGGSSSVADETGAEICIHELDASVIHHFRERLLVSSNNLRFYLDRSGMPEERIQALVQMNRWSKDSMKSRDVAHVLKAGPLPGSDVIVIHHAPGHCPGQICVQVEDILLTSDHVLSRITPNQSPEIIMRYTGLGHYEESLKKIQEIPGIRIGLGGHEDEMEDLSKRIDEIIEFHEGRLEKVLNILDEPRTLAEVSQGLFGNLMDYSILMGLLETGAHVEYLYERDQLVVTNHDEMEQTFNPVLKYQRC